MANRLLELVPDGTKRYAQAVGQDDRMQSQKRICSVEYSLLLYYESMDKAVRTSWKLFSSELSRGLLDGVKPCSHLFDVHI